MMRAASRRKNLTASVNGDSTDKKRKRISYTLPAKAIATMEPTEEKRLVKKPRSTQYVRGQPILFHCDTPKDRFSKFLKHVTIGAVRTFNSCQFASIRLTFEKNDPPTSHRLLFELPPSPILFTPKENLDFNNRSMGIVVRIVGEKGQQLISFLESLMLTAATHLSANHKLWKTLKCPLPTKEDLITWYKGPLIQDRFSEGHYLLRFRIPTSKKFLVKDQRSNIVNQDEVEEEEVRSCLASSLRTYEILEGSLNVADLWMKTASESSSQESSTCQWGIMLSAKSLTVKDREIEREDLNDAEEPILEEEEAFEQFI